MVEFRPSSSLSTGCVVSLREDLAIFCHGGSGLVGRVRSARGKSLEILRRGWELNPGHGEDRQWAIPLSYHDWLFFTLRSMNWDLGCAKKIYIHIYCLSRPMYWQIQQDVVMNIREKEKAGSDWDSNPQTCGDAREVWRHLLGSCRRLLSNDKFSMIAMWQHILPLNPRRTVNFGPTKKKAALRWMWRGFSTDVGYIGQSWKKINFEVPIFWSIFCPFGLLDLITDPLCLVWLSIHMSPGDFDRSHHPSS